LKFPLGCKLHPLTASEDGRFAMSGVKIDTTSERAPAFVVTDGRSMVVIPVELEEGEEMPTPPEGQKEILIPVDAMKAAASMKTGLHQHFVSIRIEDGQVVLRNGLGVKQSFEIVKHESLFPHYSALIPKRDGRISITFDALYLYNIMCAMRDSKSGRAVTISIDRMDSKYPILVEVGGGASGTWEGAARSVEDKLPDGETRVRNPVGVLMPIETV